jgi:hypothetical protein
MASASAMNALGIPKNPDYKLSDLKESIFLDAENETRNMKTVGQYDPVIIL